MRIGIPKEIKNNENRVAMSPSGVNTLIQGGHEVFVETSAGIGSGFSDELYLQSGAQIVSSAKEVWEKEMVIKVKEPLPEEFAYFYEGLILFTYLHLAAAPELTKVLIEKKVIGIAYETIQLDDGSLPLLAPMSEVAGRMASQIGAQFLEKPHGGKGVLLSGIPSVQRANVTIIGGGVVGTNAAKIAVGLGANVSILDLSPSRLRDLDLLFGNSINTIMSNSLNILESVEKADLVIGAVLVPGAKAPKLVTEDMVKRMQDGSVIVDVAIDQGGIFETTDRVTTHDSPTYVKHGIVHYAVPNMPGAVPRTSTIGLTNMTVPYALKIANFGSSRLCMHDIPTIKGINTFDGYVTNKAVAESLGYPYKAVNDLLTISA